MSERKAYEFSAKTKRDALRKAGLGSGHIHHRVPIWVAQKHGVDPEYVKREDNAEAVSVETHRLIHGYEKEEYYLDKVEELLIEQRGREDQVEPIEEVRWW